MSEECVPSPYRIWDQAPAFRGISEQRPGLLEKLCTLSLGDTAQDCVICKELPASAAGGFMSVGQESQEVRSRVGVAMVFFFF